MSPLVDKLFLQKLREDFHNFALIRRDIIKYSGDALHFSKRAIFALHREELKEAEEKIAEAEKMFREMHTKYKKYSFIEEEGSYRAAVEEYIEAKLFYQFVTKGKIGKVTTFKIDGESYLAGLCDLPGELYRYAIRSATKNDLKTVGKCMELASEILGELIEFNLTSYLRNKFDQAKQAVHRLEIVMYEVSLRHQK